MWNFSVRCWREAASRSREAWVNMGEHVRSLGVALGLVAVLIGCRRESAEDERERPATASAVSKGDPVADETREGAQPRRSLTDAQREALAAIDKAGGTVDGDADGFPVRIDLARDRAVADESAVKAVLQFPSLQTLRLATSRVGAETLGQLATLDQLRELLLQDAPISDQDLVNLLTALPRLRHLTLRRLSRVTDSGLEALTRCGELESVALIEMNQLSAATLETLQRVARLRALDLRNCGNLLAADFEQLTLLTGLEEVKLGGPVITDAVLSIVARHPTIRSVVIEDAQITAAWGDHLRESPDFVQRVRALSFARCYGVDDQSLSALPAFEHLETLALRNLMVTGAFLVQLAEAGVPPLPWTQLSVTDAFVTDASLAALPKIAPGLTRLDLRGNLGVTDASLDVLRQLPSLDHVSLDQTGVTIDWK